MNEEREKKCNRSNLTFMHFTTLTSILPDGGTILYSGLPNKKITGNISQGKHD